MAQSLASAMQLQIAEQYCHRAIKLLGKHFQAIQAAQNAKPVKAQEQHENPRDDAYWE